MLYRKNAEYVAAILKMLDENPAEDGDFYIHVELREQGTHRTVGRFSDEIASDCWSFEEITPVDNPPASSVR